MIMMRKIRKNLILAIALLLSLLALTGGTSLAIPNLQLDIAGGTYDSTTQTIISPGSHFTLYAYMDNLPLNYTFYLSAALVSPTVVNPNTTFDISSNYFNTAYNGTGTSNTVNFAAGGNEYVDYGVPPHYDPAGIGYDSGDLQPHGIFPTYFKEFKVIFKPYKQIQPYDTADRAMTNHSCPR